jgi:predicted ribosomally synthesized peptide with SipW-like signal peptide
MADDNEFNLSRRTVLGGLGTIGVASAGAGLGTTAYFSDQETYTDNTLTAGSLDLKVDWEEHYSDWSPDEGDGITVSMDDPTVGPGFPSAAAPTDKLLYASDKDQFLANTAVEAFPDTDDDGIQDTPSDWDICEYDADLDGVLDDEYRTESSRGDPLIELDDVKPGDFGEVTFSIHVCGNPGYVWLTGDLVDADENGNTEPEAKDTDEIGPGETDPEGRELFDNEGDESGEPSADPADTTQEPVEMLDAMVASLWYDTGSDGSYGSGDDGEGDNYHQTGEAFIPLSGSLRNILRVLQDRTVPLDYSPPGGSGTVSTNGSFPVCDDASDALGVYTNSDLGINTARNISCEQLDDLLVSNGIVETGTEYVGTKIEAAGLQAGTYSAGNGGIIKVDSVDIQGGSVTLSTNFPVEAVGVKGGNEGENNYVFEDKGGTDPAEPEEYGCILDGVTLGTPTGQAISNVEVCFDPDAPTDGDGGEEDGRECFPNSTTAYVGFEWWLPVDHANEIQTDSVRFDLGFYTEQCRHNDGSGMRRESS